MFGFVPGARGNRLRQHGNRRWRRCDCQRIGGGGRGRGSGPTVTVDGPFNPTGNPIDTASRTRIFVCRAPDPSEETACASRILSNLAMKAFRRPVTEKDLAPLMQFYDEGRKAGTFEGGIENAMVAMLSSAKFLYRVEPPPADRPKARQHLPAERYRTGLAPVVLPVEQHSR